MHSWGSAPPKKLKNTGIRNLKLKVRTGFRRFWKVMEIDNTIFQDLESFGKEIFQSGYGKGLDFCLKKF